MFLFGWQSDGRLAITPISKRVPLISSSLFLFATTLSLSVHYRIELWGAYSGFAMLGFVISKGWYSKNGVELIQARSANCWHGPIVGGYDILYLHEFR